MVLSRRAFNASLLLTAATVALRAAPASAARADDPDRAFLGRLTFGPTPEDLDHLAAIGRDAWLDEQFALPARPEAWLARQRDMQVRIEYEADDDGEGHSWPAVNELRPLSYVDAPPDAVLPLIDWETPMPYAERARPADEVLALSLARAVHTPAQLREVMTQFWHDHFNVHSQKDEYCACFFPAYDAMLREHALGNFRALLGQVARAPAMLFYLNNDASRASPANENFARELLELHTLGAGNYLNDRHARWSDVPGATEGLAEGYIDEDVFEVARAFTGWTVGDGRWIAEGVEAPRTGLFHYAEGWHDPYQKRILGREFPPNRAALADGEDVLDMLAAHPGTARFVCGKIARRLLADDPDPALVDRLAAVFLAQQGRADQIARVVRALVDDPAFAAPPGKLRRPFEYLAALYRATGVRVAPQGGDPYWQLSRAGWMQHSFPPPTGHPDRSEDWTSSTVILRMVDFATTAHDDWFGGTRDRLSDHLPDGLADLRALADHWAARLTGGPFEGLEDLLGEWDAAPDDPLPESADERHDLSAALIAFAALTPSVFYR